jgi:uncharacterized protein YegL
MRCLLSQSDGKEKEMKQGHGRIAIVLDRSGSMREIASATVEGYNEFINGQKAAPGTADVLLMQFDTVVEKVYDLPLTDIVPLAIEQFVPRGSTAMLDAIGITITGIGARLATLPEDQRPDSVTIVIITDGHENASIQYKHDQIADMIKHQSEVYNWKFVYLGARQDAVLTAQGFNIPKAQTMTYSASSAGIGHTMSAMNSYTVSNRMAGASGQSVRGFTEDERKAALAQDPPVVIVVPVETGTDSEED